MGGDTLHAAAMPPQPFSSDSHCQSLAVPAASSMTAAAASSAKDTPLHGAIALDELPRPALLQTAPKTASTKKHKKKKSKGSMSELTPLILKDGEMKKKNLSSEEEIHPLPWFRSPDMTRKSPMARDKNRKTKYRRGRSGYRDEPSLCSTIMSKLCCGLVGGDAEADLEYGVVHDADGEQLESEGFKKCVQLLVGLIVVVAAVLIIMVIFEPFQQQAGLW